VYDYKVFYSITAREIILEWDKAACRFVFSYWTWTWTWTWLLLDLLQVCDKRTNKHTDEQVRTVMWRFWTAA